MFRRLIAVVTVLVCSALGLTTTPADAAGCTAWSGAPSLQQAVLDNVCVVVLPGTYTLSGTVAIPDGHTLQGLPGLRNLTVLKAGYANTGPFSGMLQNYQPLGLTRAVTVSDLTIDAMRQVTLGIVMSGVTIDSVTVRGARCDGISFLQNVSILNSTIEHNGFDCGTNPPAAGIYSGTRMEGTAGPIIVGNRIVNNAGAGIDVATVYSGQAHNNTIENNGGNAGITLYMSRYWDISGNTVIVNGNNSMAYATCGTRGPAGGKPAAIRICGPHPTLDSSSHRITANRAVSFYGILLAGSDTYEPRSIYLSGNSVVGSSIGCADDYRPGQLDSNQWVDNDCNGINSQPIYY